ncbi:alpha/beta hydrolase [Mitsuaria sp. WAJ17]|uniref:alpha/beta hydrolase n=1 Tax=Mitsuaria sp. WAJ17 TaxID=2761452 RepID=UPI0016026CAF|nr:alpha/beta hydrolase-fold protein [Mitsuaria sp. WAJ17]MBB2484819.1 alpha/beta hydrolase [Mitsuaria sp. WAJ17]
MPRLILHVLLLCCLLPLSWPGGAQADPAPYVLDRTEVHRLHSRLLQRDYELYIGLPPESEAGARLPLLFVTDAPVAFPVIRAMSRRLGREGPQSQQMVLVGLSYALGDSPTVSRNRDYTPSRRASSAEDSSSTYGQAEAYVRFIREEVLPYLAAHVPQADLARRYFAGHSYGGLLGAHVLLHHTDLFQRYILSSPSLWYDQERLLREAEQLAAKRQPLKAQVLLLAGAKEQEAPGRRPRPGREADGDIVGNTRRFEQALRQLPGLQVQRQIIPDEDHLSAFPSAMVRGLRWALPRR